MDAAADRPEFAPPQQPGMLRALVLAVLAHLLLVAALTYGLRWQRETPVVAAEAELWSQLPQQAAPKEEPAPPPPPAPPVVKAPPLPDPQVQRDAQIALEREKAKREAEEREERRQEELAKERDRKRKLEAEKKKEQELARKREEELERKQEQQRVAEARRKEEDKKRKQEEQQAKKLAQLREENMKRMQGLAGASGGPTSTGNAMKSSGPSASWAGRVVARVRPNIVFTDDLAGNPKTEVEVRCSPDGTIVGKRIMKSSGSKAWDEAVLRALEKTEVLPRDIDGRVPSPVVIEFRPKG